MPSPPLTAEERKLLNSRTWVGLCPAKGTGQPYRVEWGHWEPRIVGEGEDFPAAVRAMFASHARDLARRIHA